MKYNIIPSIVLLIMIFFSCGTPPKQIKSAYRTEKFTGTIIPGQWLTGISVQYIVNNIPKECPLQIYFPKNYNNGTPARTLIALHNYEGSLTSWGKKTNIEHYANKYGFILVCPEMGRTIYETKYYPETTRRWNGIPGGKWVGDILLPYLQQKFSIALKKEKTGILGYSTGARGAFIIASNYPQYFSAVAGLSGDYDPISMPKDRLLTSVYGTYKNFPERWSNDDNIIKQAIHLKNTYTFIAHGEKDGMVPCDQSRLLTIRLLQLMNKDKSYYKPEFYIKVKKFHNWEFWRMMVPPMMEFFDRSLK